MRNRNGFVSNSSSSSFIIAWKPESSEDEIRYLFKTACNVPKESPLSGLHEYVFNTFIDNVDERFDTMEDLTKWADANCYMMDDFKDIKKHLENGLTVWYGKVSTDDGSMNPIEHYLANHDFNYEVDGLIIAHEGKY